MSWEGKKLVWSRYARGETVQNTIIYLESLEEAVYTDRIFDRDSIGKVRKELREMPLSMMKELVKELPEIQGFVEDVIRPDFKGKLPKLDMLPGQEVVTSKAMEEHFNELAEVAGWLLANELETVRPNQWTDRQEFQDILYWIGYDVENQEGIKETQPLTLQLDENMVATASMYPTLLIECLIQHVDAELKAVQSKSFDELLWNDPYVVIDILRTLSYRKTFKGKCQICEKL
ncbi:MAG: hypothetical protein GY861_06195 [bacterium]|nr:hypothetical protein [bacterium]